MLEVISFVGLIISELGRAIFDNYFFWVVLALVAFQYRRIAKNREYLFGIVGNSVLKETALATAFGLAGGLACSFLLVFIGINVNGLGIAYIWPLALFLILISPRFLCFSYAGGIVALSSLVFGFPKVDIPQLMGLIAILHLVESLLIYLSGHTGATPMFTKTASGRLVGGFTLQKFWPLPIVAVGFFPHSLDLTILPSMPDWWPVIKYSQIFNIHAVGLLIPFVAGLGYGDLALAKTPLEKSKISARNLSIYSLVLFFLALAASRFHVFQYLAVLFAPLGHEAVIYIGQKTELRGTPVFVPPVVGVRVLEAVSNTPAIKAGIRPGDVIHAINRILVNSKRDVEQILLEKPRNVEIEYVSYADKKYKRASVQLHLNQPLGIIAVPEGDELVYSEMVNQSIFSRIIQRFRK